MVHKRLLYAAQTAYKIIKFIILYTNIPLNIADRKDKTALNRKPKQVSKLKTIFEMRLYIKDDTRLYTLSRYTIQIYIYIKQVY